MDGGVLPPSAALIFSEGIALVLSRWPAMEVVVMNEWGGRDTRLKAQNLCRDVFEYFTTNINEPLYIDDLENLIDKIMTEELNTGVDDGTIEEVAYKLMIMHEECLAGNYQSVQRMREAPRAIDVPLFRQDDDDDGNMVIDQPDGNMVIDQPDGNIVIDQPDGNIVIDHQPDGNIGIDQPGPPPMPTVPDADGWTTVSSRRNRRNRN